MNGYNGWENRETWAVALHLGCDESLYLAMKEMKALSKDWIELSEKIKNLFIDLRSEASSNPTIDVVNLLLDIGSFERVNFDEIAQSFFNDGDD
ncbi:MAG: hypothetical protein WC635_17515 [Bacteriovorax sp.]|jgi:hypothetical protein